MTRFLSLVLLCLLGLSAPAVAADCGDTRISAGKLCLAFRSFGPGESGQPLVVLLHGDLSRGGPANYMANWARALAEANPGTNAVALARPGYGFSGGPASSGSNNRRRDHYTEGNNAAVAAAIMELRTRLAPSRVILVGHSGGAAMAGVIAGRHPDAAEAYVLISCPCDIRRWRRMRGKQNWANSLSPADHVDGIPPGRQVVLVTGSRDRNTKPVLAEEHLERLQEAGITADFIKVDGAGHNLNNSLWTGGVLPAIKNLLNH